MDDNKIIELYLSRDESAIRETQEKYGSYIYRNVKVHQGATADAATVSISSVDAEKL